MWSLSPMDVEPTLRRVFLPAAYTPFATLRQQEDLMPACIKANAIQVLLRNLPTMSQPQTGSVDGGVLLATTARPCALSRLPTFPRSEAFLSALLFLLLCRRVRRYS